jgi:hypothetical protein
MNIIPYYLFMTLFIGFMIIYVFGNDYYIILKNKNMHEDTDCVNCKP